MAIISILKHIKLAHNACISKFIPLLINLAYDRFTFIASLWCSDYNIKIIVNSDMHKLAA